MSLIMHACALSRQLSVCEAKCCQYRQMLSPGEYTRRPALSLCATRYGRLGMRQRPGLPRWAGTRKVKPKPIWISWSKRQWVAMGSARPYANLHHSQTDNHASTPPLSSLQAWCPSCHPTKSVKAPKAIYCYKQCRVIKGVDLRLPGGSKPKMQHSRSDPTWKYVGLIKTDLTSILGFTGIKNNNSY